MKKLLIFGLALMLMGTALFADDAKVMPMMVGRVYVVPTYSFANGAFDAEGNLQRYKDPVKLFNLGAAVEYGITNWITGAIQWTPGWTPWSDVAPAAKDLLGSLNSTSDVNTNGIADLFIGAKLQLIGEKAPLVDKNLRFSVAPGVIIPFSGPNFEDEFNNVLKSDTATISNMDNHVFGYGARLYLDFIANEHFFFNFYNETILYPAKLDYNKAGPTWAGTKAGLAQGLGTLAGMVGMADPTPLLVAGNAVTADINYKYRLTFEIEPQYSTSVGKGVIFSAGLPFNYRYMPPYEYSLNNTDALLTQFKAFAAMGVPVPTTDKGLLDYLGMVGYAQQSISFNPNVSLFLTQTPLPLEFKFQYAIPVWGENTMARNNLTLQIKAYFALPGRPQ